MKVGIVVSQDFFGNHVGVRNYVLGLGTILSETMRVDYLARHPNPSGAAHWYQMQPISRRFVADSSAIESIRLEGTPREVYEAYRVRLTKPAPGLPTIPRLAIGTDLAAERYDVLIISSPWCIEFRERLPARRIIGLAFDTIPNSICFTNWDVRPFSFAGEHVRGYRYYRDHADLIYSISPDTSASLSEFFSISSEKIATLPPFLPVGYLGLPLPAVERGPNLILACPFDPRKGMALIPGLVNAVVGSLGKLQIYGSPRCAPDLVTGFFDKLDPRLRVVWYPTATTETVAALFAESRLLLFPSHREGLGLPILEAQVCGSRVAAYPIPPMSDNMLAGAIPLGDSTEKNAERIAEALSDGDFDHAALSRDATAKYSFDTIRAALRSSVFAIRHRTEQLQPEGARTA